MEIERFKGWEFSLIPSLKQHCIVKICSMYILKPEMEVMLDALDSIPNLKEEVCEMCKRMRFNASFLGQLNNKELRNMKSIAWTPYGTVNMKETFRRNMHTFDIRNRFNMACYFCLKDVIEELWRETNGTVNLNRTLPLNQPYIQPVLVLFWTKYCQRRLVPDDEIQSIIRHSLRYSLYYAFHYFWYRVSANHKAAAMYYFVTKDLKLISNETILLVNHMISVTNREKLHIMYARHGPTMLLCLSYVYSAEQFLSCFEHFLRNKYISVTNALTVTIKLYSCMCKDYNRTYHNSLVCKYRRDGLFKKSLGLVLNQDVDVQEIEDLYQHIADYYQEMIIWHFKSDELTTKIIVRSKAVEKIVHMYAYKNSVLLDAYYKAVRSPSVKTLMVFMFQFTLTQRWINMEL